MIVVGGCLSTEGEPRRGGAGAGAGLCWSPQSVGRKRSARSPRCTSGTTARAGAALGRSHPARQVAEGKHDDDASTDKKLSFVGPPPHHPPPSCVRRRSSAGRICPHCSSTPPCIQSLAFAAQDKGKHHCHQFIRPPHIAPAGGPPGCLQQVRREPSIEGINHASACRRESLSVSGLALSPLSSPAISSKTSIVSLSPSIGTWMCLYFSRTASMCSWCFCGTETQEGGAHNSRSGQRAHIQTAQAAARRWRGRQGGRTLSRSATFSSASSGLCTRRSAICAPKTRRSSQIRSFLPLRSHARAQVSSVCQRLGEALGAAQRVRAPPAAAAGAAGGTSGWSPGPPASRRRAS